MTLTKKQQKLYSDLIKEYNANNWSVICGIERFIKTKIENCTDVWQHMNLCAVLEYAENDF
jgi:hypothetical protein